MKELKTLKDLKKARPFGMIHTRDDILKAEAVKWVKGLTTTEQRSWIKHFFNLTEEDLK